MNITDLQSIQNVFDLEHHGYQLPQDALHDETGAPGMGTRLASFVRARLGEPDAMTGFDQLVHDLAASLVAAVPCEVDSEIVLGLRELGEFLLVDRIQMFRRQDAGILRRTHEWQAADGLFVDNAVYAPSPRIRRILEADDCGLGICCEESGDPEFGDSEWSCRTYSRVVVPVTAGGALMGLLIFDSVAMPPDWAEPALMTLQYFARVIHLVLGQSEMLGRTRPGLIAQLGPETTVGDFGLLVELPC